MKKSMALRTLAFLVLLFVFLLSFEWLTLEPSRDGKTVTEWLDCMALVDTTRTNSDTIRLGFRHDEFTNDPSLKALLQIGSNAIPVLVKTIVEPLKPDPKFNWRVRSRDWLQRKWQQVRWSGRVLPRYYPPNRHVARKLAAALTLLALGTNSNGGLSRVLEARAATPEPPDSLGPHFSFYEIRGGLDLERAVAMGWNNLPDRQEEIIAAITAGLYHTNAAIREGAAVSAKMYMRFKDRNVHVTDQVYEAWRNRLIALVHDHDVNMGCAALTTLMYSNPEDEDIRALAEGVLRDRTNPARLRIAAADGLGRVYPKGRATNSLPLLKEEAMRDPNPYLRDSASRAIRDIEGKD